MNTPVELRNFSKKTVEYSLYIIDTDKSQLRIQVEPQQLSIFFKVI